MDSDLKNTEEVVVDKESAVNEDKSTEAVIKTEINSDEILMSFDSFEDQTEDQKPEGLVDTNNGLENPVTNCLVSEDITSTPHLEEEEEFNVDLQFYQSLRNEEVLANDVMNLDVNEDILVNNNDNKDNEESKEVNESQNTPEADPHISSDFDMSSDNPVIRNESTSDSPKIYVEHEGEQQTNDDTSLPLFTDDEMSDSNLRIAGLKTSLMISEDKCKELEEELKKVYQHLFKCLEEKKNLQKKCDTLEEQMEKLMATSSHKRPAQESPGTASKSTPPKKTPNIRQNADQKANSMNKKSVRFQEQKPFFGRFGARYQENDMTPPPYPGRFAPAFQPPPMIMASRTPPSPVGAYRGAPIMAAPEMTDIALNDGFQLISTIGNRLHLTATIVDRAIRLFRQCYESPLRAMCRTQNQSTATACVYIACREEHCPQTFKTLCSVSKIDFKVMSQCCKYIVNAFGLCLDQMSIDEAVVEFSARSGLSPPVQRAAYQIARRALQMNLLPAKSPLTTAAVAIFMAAMASDDQRPAFEIAVLTGVGDNTIRNSYNRLLSYARQLFPQNFPFFTLPEQLPRV